MRAFLAVLLMLCAPALAQEHQHPPQDVPLHERFYSGWNVPNGGQERVSSCCNKSDCAPAETKFENGKWWGRRATDPDWIHIPSSLIESNQGDPRESPDGQSHMCVHPYNGKVLCALLGGGT